MTRRRWLLGAVATGAVLALILLFATRPEPRPVSPGPRPSHSDLADETRRAAGLYPRTDSGIHLGLTLGTTVRSVDPLTAAFDGRVDYVWSSPTPRPETQLLAGAHLDFYLAPLWSDWAAQSIPGHSLAWFQEHHPAWIAYRCVNGRPTKQPAWYGGSPGSFDRVPLDITNPAVQRYLLQRAESALRAGYAGISLDNIVFTNYQHVCGTYRVARHGRVDTETWHSLHYPSAATSNAKLRHDVLAYLSFMSRSLKRDFPGKTITGNTAGGAGVPLETFARYFNGLMDEFPIVSPSGQRVTGASWVRHMTFAENVQRLGKAYIEVVYAPPAVAGAALSVQRSFINWALSNYLLIKGSHAYTYIHRLRPGFAALPEYSTPIGTATGPRSLVEGAQIRRYSGGIVAVNPSPSGIITLHLGRAYHDLFGNTWSSARLGPATGIVLLDINA